MAKEAQSIKSKLRGVILLTSATVLLLTASAFVAYELFYFRKSLEENTSTISQMTAANASSALAFQDEEAAIEVLSSLRADPFLDFAILYDENGQVFATYPTNTAKTVIPLAPGKEGIRFEKRKIIAVRPVHQSERHLGFLYLQSDLQ